MGETDGRQGYRYGPRLYPPVAPLPNYLIMTWLQNEGKFNTQLLHVCCLVVLAIITALYSWPLISELTTAIPGTATDQDVATFVWNHGRIYEAIQNQESLLETDAVLLPFGADLRLHTYGLLQGLAAYPFTGWLGVVGAFNLVLIVSLWLNGTAVYALIYEEVKEHWAALVAAVLVMFGTPVLVQFRVGRPSFGALWIIALALLAFRRLLVRPSLGNMIGLGLLLLAALLSDFQILFYTTLWLGLYGVYWTQRALRGRETQRNNFGKSTGIIGLIFRVRYFLVQNKKQLVSLVISSLIVLIPFLFIYFPALISSGTGDYPRPGLQGMRIFSFAIRNYFQWQIVPSVYGGYGLLLGLVMGIVSFRRRWVSGFWLVGTAVFLLLALGPFLEPTDIPLPFAGFSIFPPLRQFRTPGRLTIPALIGLGVIAGSVLVALRPYLRKGWLVWVVAGGLVIGRLWFAIANDPFQVQTYPAYAFYEEQGQEPGDYALLEVPFGVRSGLDRIGQGGEILEYYQHIHHKRLLNGMIARVPNDMFQFYRSQPVLLFLSGEPTTAATEDLQGNLREVLSWSEACYIVVHLDMLEDTAVSPILEFLDSTPTIIPYTQEPNLMVYSVQENPTCPR